MRIAQFEAIDEMLETNEVAPIKSYIHISALDYAEKIEKIKQTANLGQMQAKLAKKVRWQRSRFTTRLLDKVMTNKEIEEIIQQWRHEMRKFV